MLYDVLFMYAYYVNCVFKSYHASQNKSKHIIKL